MLNCFPWLHVFGVFFLSNHISLSSLLFFLCLFHQMTHVLFVFRPLPPDPPAFSGFLLRFPLPYITCRKSKHGKNEGVLVEWLTSNSSPREGIFFSLFFFICLSFFFVGVKVQGWQNVQSPQDQRRALCFSEWWGLDWIQRVCLCQAASRLSFRLYPPSCLSLSFPLLFLSIAVAPLNVHSISLYLLPASVFSVHSLSLSVILPAKLLGICLP